MMINLLVVVANRIAGIFNVSGAIQAIEIDISKALNQVRHVVPLHKIKS